MATSKITFDDKVSTIISPLPAINRIRAEDVNEIKSVVNAHADAIDGLTLSTSITNATDSFSQGAMTYFNRNKTLTNAGYMPIAVAGVVSNTNEVSIQGFYLSDVASGTCKVNYKGYNSSTESKSPTITIYVSWIKI